MPFALPEYDRAFSEFVHDTVHALATANSPLLSGIEVESSNAAASVVDARDSATLDLPAKSVRFGITMDVSAVREGNFESLVIEMSNASDELGRELVGLLLENV